MKHELLMLRSLLVASLLVCGLILGNMLTYAGEPIQLANLGAVNLSSAATVCAVPPDGVACPFPAS